MKYMKRIGAVLLCAAVVLSAVFLIGRYGWKLNGFNACQSPGIDSVEVSENAVRITGFYPGSFPEGFIGCHTEQVDGTLYVGFRFSGLFGFLENGDFDITIPTDGTVSQVVVKTGEQEYPIWPEKENPGTDAAEAPAVPTVYEQILDRYRTALKENWDGQQLTDAKLNRMVREIAPDTVGYAVDDLDDNGIPELAIASISGDDFYGNLIFDLYTVGKDGEPVSVFVSIERDRYYYAGGSLFANQGSFSADESVVTAWKLEGEGLTEATFSADPTEYVQMELVTVLEPDGK